MLRPSTYRVASGCSPELAVGQPNRAVGHFQGLEDLLANVFLIRHPRDDFHQVTRQGQLVVVVTADFPRRQHPRRHMGRQIFTQGHQPFLAGCPDTHPAGIETAGHIDQVPGRYRLGEGGRQLEGGQVFVDIRIQVQFSRFGQLQDGQGRDRFGNGPGPQDRSPRIHRSLAGSVCVAVAFFHHHLPISHHDHDGAVNPILDHFPGEECIPPGFVYATPGL